jgi:hypothetical protein
LSRRRLYGNNGLDGVPVRSHKIVATTTTWIVNCHIAHHFTTSQRLHYSDATKACKAKGSNLRVSYKNTHETGKLEEAPLVLTTNNTLFAPADASASRAPSRSHCVARRICHDSTQHTSCAHLPVLSILHHSHCNHVVYERRRLRHRTCSPTIVFLRRGRCTRRATPYTNHTHTQYTHIHVFTQLSPSRATASRRHRRT